MRFAILVLVLFTTSGCASGKSAEREQREPTSVDDVVQQAVGDGFAGDAAPGATVVAVTVGGARHVYGFGEVDGIPPGLDSVYPLGTATEPFAATLLARRVADGEVEYDESVGARSCLETQITAYCFRGDATTYADLVRHAAALPPTLDEKGSVGPDQLNDFLAGYDLGIAPGKRYRHSVVSYAALGTILERRFGEPAVAAVERDVLDPLGLAATTFEPSATVPGYANGSPVEEQLQDGVHRFARGLAANAGDLLTFVEANLLPENHGDLAEALRLSQRFSDVITVRDHSRAGNGWYYRPDRSVHWHDGASTGHRVFLGFDVEDRTGVVVLTNEASAPAEEVGFRILQGIEKLRGAASASDQGSPPS